MKKYLSFNLSLVATLVLSLAGCENFSNINSSNIKADKTAMSSNPISETSTSSKPLADKGYSAVMPVSSQPVPAFELPDLFTQKTITNADLPKRPYLINFWATWNDESKAEHPFLLQLAKQGVPIVGVNFKDDTAEALNYLKINQNPFVLTVQDKQGSFREKGLMGIPESFVVDGNNKVRLHIWGAIDQARLDTHILPCLDELNKNANENKLKQVCQ